MGRRTLRIARYKRNFELDESPIFNQNRRSQAEKALGATVPPDIWQLIDDVTKVQISLATNETSPPLASPVRKKLKLVVAAVEALAAELGHQTPLRNWYSANQIHHSFFEEKTWSKNTTPDRLINLLAHSLDALLAVASVVEEDIVFERLDATAVAEGTNWNFWIMYLTMFLRDHGLPHKVRKDQLGKGPSAFVQFVEVLQFDTPSYFRRFTHSHDALAQGISRARKYQNRG